MPNLQPNSSTTTATFQNYALSEIEKPSSARLFIQGILGQRTYEENYRLHLNKCIEMLNKLDSEELQNYSRVVNENYFYPELDKLINSPKAPSQEDLLKCFEKLIKKEGSRSAVQPSCCLLILLEKAEGLKKSKPGEKFTEEIFRKASQNINNEIINKIANDKTLHINNLISFIDKVITIENRKFLLNNPVYKEKPIEIIKYLITQSKRSLSRTKTMGLLTHIFYGFKSAPTEANKPSTANKSFDNFVKKVNEYEKAVEKIITVTKANFIKQVTIGVFFLLILVAILLWQILEQELDLW